MLSARAGEEATIYRDEYGIPHVFAPTLEAASFAVGYAQAEDRLEELLKNYRRANGTMAEIAGPDSYRTDLIQRMWRHEAVSREREQVRLLALHAEADGLGPAGAVDLYGRMRQMMPRPGDLGVNL